MERKGILFVSLMACPPKRVMTQRRIFSEAESKQKGTTATD